MSDSNNQPNCLGCGAKQFDVGQGLCSDCGAPVCDSCVLKIDENGYYCTICTTFDKLKEAFCERCEKHADEAAEIHGTGDNSVTPIYRKYAEQVRNDGCLPNHSDSWATDCFAFVFNQTLREDTYQYYFNKMFPKRD